MSNLNVPRNVPSQLATHPKASNQAQIAGSPTRIRQRDKQQPTPSKDTVSINTFSPLTKLQITSVSSHAAPEPSLETLITNFLKKYPEYALLLNELQQLTSTTSAAFEKTLLNSDIDSRKKTDFLEILNAHNSRCNSKKDHDSPSLSLEGEGGEDSNQKYSHNGVEMIIQDNTARRERTMLMMWLISDMWERAKATEQTKTTSQTLMSPTQRFKEAWMASPYSQTSPACTLETGTTLAEILKTLQHHPYRI